MTTPLCGLSPRHRVPAGPATLPHPIHDNGTTHAVIKATSAQARNKKRAPRDGKCSAACCPALPNNEPGLCAENTRWADPSFACSYQQPWYTPRSNGSRELHNQGGRQQGPIPPTVPVLSVDKRHNSRNPGTPGPGPERAAVRDTGLGTLEEEGLPAARTTLRTVPHLPVSPPPIPAPSRAALQVPSPPVTLACSPARQPQSQIDGTIKNPPLFVTPAAFSLSHLFSLASFPPSRSSVTFGSAGAVVIFGGSPPFNVNGRVFSLFSCGFLSQLLLHLLLLVIVVGVSSRLSYSSSSSSPSSRFQPQSRFERPLAVPSTRRPPVFSSLSGSFQRPATFCFRRHKLFN